MGGEKCAIQAKPEYNIPLKKPYNKSNGLFIFEFETSLLWV